MTAVAPGTTRPACPRLTLTPAAFAAARATETPPGVQAGVLRELAEVGALVRDDDGAVLVDPALQVLLRRWDAAPVVLDLASGRETGVRRVSAGLDGEVTVCVATTSQAEQVVGPVEISVPTVGDLVSEAVACLGRDEPGAGPVVWLRVRGPGRTWVDRLDDPDDDLLVRRMTSPLVQAVQDQADCRAASGDDASVDAERRVADR